MIASTSWGVLVAQHRQLKLAQQALVSRNIEFFIPVEETLTCQRGRVVRVARPILGDYVLITVTSLWYELVSERGVAGVLLNDLGYPAQVLPHELERLQQFVPSPETSEFEYGEEVTPQEGPFAFHIGRYDRKTNKGDDVVFFTLFGREQRVTFKSGELIKAAKRNSGRWKQLTTV